MVSAHPQTIDWSNVDLAHQKIRLNDEVVAWPVRENGERVYRIEDRKTHRFYRLGLREYMFVSLLDGRLTVAAACGMVAAGLGREALTQREAESIVVWVLEERLGAMIGMDGVGLGREVGESQGQSSRHATGWLGRLNPFWMQIPIVRNTQPLAGLFDIIGRGFCSAVTGAMLLVIVAAMFAYAFHFGEVHQSAGDLFSRDGWIYLLVTWVALKIVHELGHAIACHRMGGEAGEMGIVMVLFAPLAYVDVTSCWRMRRASSRMIVSAAGMYVELVIAAIAMFGWLYVETPSVQFWLANVVVTAGVSTILFNANPLMRFDGYYLLSDAVQVPNLYSESSEELKRLFSGFRGHDANTSGHYRGGRRWFLVGYAIAALAWRIAICFALCMTASVMFSGAGLVLAAMGVAAWFGKPVRAFLEARIDEMRYDKPRFFRSLLFSAAVVLLLSVTFFVPLPKGVDVPAVVRDVPEAIVRSEVDGFLDTLHVSDGDFVETGTLLAVLENDELRNELSEMEIDLAEVRLRKRYAVNQHQASNEWVARRDEDSILEKIRTLRSQVSGLELVASTSGWVSIDDAHSLPGRYIREGQEVVRVRDPQRKEFVGLIAQTDVTFARSIAGKSVSIRDVANRNFECTVKQVDPRATRKLPADSLSAIYGGPMNVERADQETEDQAGMQLAEPHFLIRGDLPAHPASAIATGNRIRVNLGQRYESLWQRSCRWIRKSFQQRRDEAAG